MIGDDYEMLKDFSEEERSLLQQLSTASAADRDTIVAILALHLGVRYKHSMNGLINANWYLARTYQASINRLIASNEKVATTSARYANALNRLTAALVILGALGVTVSLLDLFTKWAWIPTK